MAHLGARIMIVALLGVVAVSCSDGDDDVDADRADPESSVLPQCPADEVEVDESWPFLVPAALTTTEFSTDDLTFVVRGVANDPEAVLVDAISVTFEGYEISEPEGDAGDPAIVATSASGTGSVSTSDNDGDGCWDIEIEVEYVQAPPPAGPAPSTTLPPAVDPLDLANAVGTGQIVTARGTFPLAVASCTFEPLSVEASSTDGVLTVTQAADGKIGVVWRYDDGVEVSDSDSRVLALEVGSAVGLVADGENPDGPETLIIDLTC